MKNDKYAECNQVLYGCWEVIWAINRKGLYCAAAATAAKLLQSCPILCNPIDGSPPGSPSLGFSRQGHWSGLPFPSPMHESEKWKWSCSFVPDSKSLQLCLMLCDLMDCSLHGSSVHGILQARMLEWIQCPPLGHLSNSGIEPTSLMSPAWQAGSLPLAQPGKLQKRAAKCTKCQIFYVCHFIYFSKVHYKVVAVTLIF